MSLKENLEARKPRHISFPARCGRAGAGNRTAMEEGDAALSQDGEDNQNKLHRCWSLFFRYYYILNPVRNVFNQFHYRSPVNKLIYNPHIHLIFGIYMLKKAGQ